METKKVRCDDYITLNINYMGLTSLFELPIPVIFVSFVIAPIVAKNQIFLALLVTSIVLVVSMAITMFVKEKPASKDREKIDWRPFVNLIWMTAAFTVVILGLGEVVKFSATLDLLQPSPVPWVIV